MLYRAIFLWRLYIFGVDVVACFCCKVLLEPQEEKQAKIGFHAFFVYIRVRSEPLEHQLKVAPDTYQGENYATAFSTCTDSCIYPTAFDY